MANNFIAACYAICKSAGIDTSKMSTEQVIDKANELRGKKDAKEKGKEIVKEYLKRKEVGGRGSKEYDGNGDDDIDSTIGQKNKFYKETIDRKDENKVKSKVSEITNRLLEYDVEHLVIIDKFGHIYEKVGDKNYVYGIGVDLDGAIDIHNHINNISFSTEDIKTMSKNKNTKFVLTTKNCIYRAKFIKDLDISLTEVRNIGLQKALEAGELELMLKDESNANDYMMEFLKEGGYIQYEKTNGNSRS